jgi:hypothetical protein
VIIIPCGGGYRGRVVSGVPGEAVPGDSVAVAEAAAAEAVLPAGVAAGVEEVWFNTLVTMNSLM